MIDGYINPKGHQTMKSPCLHCKNSRWLHDPNDYFLPIYSHCTKEFQTGPEKNRCSGFESMSVGVVNLINENVKKYHTKGRT